MSKSDDHSNKSLQELEFDLTQFSSGRVNEVISRVSNISLGVSSFREIFSAEAKTQELAGNSKQADTYQVLYLVSDIALNSGDKNDPFKPSSWIGNRRSPVPDDFTESQISSLEQAVTFLCDPRLVARLSDIVWVKLKKIASAKCAIEAYLKAARDDRMMEIERFSCLERAFRLAIQINSRENWSACEAVFENFRKLPVLYERLSIDLLSLSQSLRIMSPQLLAEECSTLGKVVIGNDLYQGKQLLLMAATNFAKLGDKKSATSCHRITADAFVSAVGQSDALTSMRFIEEAIEALRRAGAPKSEVQGLINLLAAKGQESIAQMKRIEGPKVNFTESVNVAVKLVEGLPANEALKKIALEFPVLSYDEHKSRVQESIKNHPLLYFIEAKYITREGRQYSRRPSFMSEDPDDREFALETEIATAMAPLFEATVKFCLVPGVNHIHWTTKDLQELFNFLSHRPFVPPGRAAFFFSGIQAGLAGEFIEAAHILVPQIENSIRFLLEVRGHNVTSLNSENLQSEMSLNVLFDTYRSEISDIFGADDDFVYIMESFLCRKSGQNFRNELSHGLVGEARDYRFAFAWWLAVYLLYRLKFSKDPNTV